MKEARGGGSWIFFFFKGGGGLGGAGWSMVDAPRSSIKSIPGSEKERVQPERHSHPLSLIM